MILKRQMAVVATAAFVVAMIPAAVQALRGIFETQSQKSFDDCKREGIMAVDPIDNSSATTVTSDNVPLMAAGETQGKYARPQSSMSAGEYAKVEPTVEFCKGGTAGNVAGNNRHASYPADTGTTVDLEDQDEWKLEATCNDCPSGKIRATLKQRIWQKTSIVWTPAAPDHVPNSSVTSNHCEDIKGDKHQLSVSLTYIPQSDKVISSVLSWTNLVVHQDGTFGGTAVGAAITDDGSQSTNSFYNSPQWSADNSRTIVAEVSRDDIDLQKTLDCTSDTESGNVTVSFKYRLAVEDKTNPQTDPDTALMTKIKATMEYGTLILLWKLEVTRNCDNTTTACPCNKFLEAMANKPNVP